MIFANHAHIYPEYFRPSGTVDALKRHMDICGIDKCVAFATFPYIIRENNFNINANKFLYDEIKNCPDIYGFGTVDFEEDNLEEQVDEIHSYGFKGVKLHPQAQEFKIDGERAFRVYKKCEELGLFISFHSGVHWHRLKDTAVVLFDEVAYNFKNLRFSMEHMGGYSYFNDALAVMVNNCREGLQPRVYAGWTSISGENGAWSISDSQLHALLKQTSDNNSIFGLDFPFRNAKTNIADIERIKNLDIPSETKDKIFGKNLAAALGIEL